MVGTAQAAVLRNAVEQVDTPVRARGLDQPERDGAVPVEHEVLAEQADRLGRVRLELRAAADGQPVAPEQRTHGRARTDVRQPLVLLDGEHGGSLLC